MSIRDTKYTSPEALRNMYRNPKRPVRDVAADTVAASNVLNTPSSALPGGVGSGGGGMPAHVIPSKLKSVPIIPKPDSVPEKGIIERELLI